MNVETERKRVKIGGHEVMTYSRGKGERVLMVVHGGPGMPSWCDVEPHWSFVDEGYRVVTWDQLGCGESDKPEDENLWELGRFVEELEEVRKGLGIGKMDLLGHSWGGVLGLEYCLKYLGNVRSFIGVNTSFDLDRMQRGFERKKMALGEETCTMMALREAEGTTEHPEYQAAVTLLMYRNVCRMEKWPEVMVRSLENLAKPVFSKVFGPYFFNNTGTLKGYNRLDELWRVEVPTLLVHGEHDYIVPECACIAMNYLPRGELKILRGCSHAPFFEDEERYREVVLEFLERV